MVGMVVVVGGQSTPNLEFFFVLFFSQQNPLLSFFLSVFPLFHGTDSHAV